MFKAYTAIFITIVFFSTIEVAVKLVNTAAIDPIFLAFLRFMPAGVILLACDFRKLPLFSKNDFLLSFVLSLIGVTAGFSCFHISLRYINASTGAVIFSINPIITALAAAAILHEALHGRIVYGIVLGFAGVYLVSFGFSLPVITSVKGPVLMAVSSLCFGIYISAAKLLVKKHGPVITNGVIFVTGSLFLIPFIQSWSLPHEPLQLAVIAYLILFATTLAYVLYFYGLSRVPLAAGNSLFYLKPVIAAILSVLLLHEQLNAHFYLGLALITFSLVLTTFPRKIRKISTHLKSEQRGQRL